MATAETARLIASLELQDHLSAGVKTASGAIGSLETKFGGLSASLGHAKSQLGGLISGPLGLLGLGGGLVGLEQLVSSSLAKTDQLGEAIEKLTGVTGMSATQASMFVAVFSRFGLDADKASTSLAFMEKALGNLTKTAGSEKTFVDEFGFSLRDTAGTVKDTQTVFEDLADYWVNKTIPQSQKAALAAKLLGKSYVDLVPALNEGSKGIKDIEQTARDLGLVLDDQNMGQLKDYHDSMEKMGMAVGALQLAIGLGLAPVMEEFAGAVTDWIKGGGSKQITTWLKDAAGFAKTLGGVIKDDVVPVFGAIANAWAQVPDDLKKILLGGLVAQKATSWLFGGGGMLGALSGLLKGGASVATGGGVGGLGVQKVYVVNMGAGGMGGGTSVPGATGGASKLLGAVSIIGSVAIAAASIYELKQTWDQVQHDVTVAQGDTKAKIADYIATSPAANGTDTLAAQVKLFRDNTSNVLGDLLTITAANEETNAAFVAAADKIVASGDHSTAAADAIRGAIDADGHLLEHATGQQAIDIQKGLDKLKTDLGLILGTNQLAQHNPAAPGTTTDVTPGGSKAIAANGGPGGEVAAGNLTVSVENLRAQMMDRGFGPLTAAINRLPTIFPTPIVNVTIGADSLTRVQNTTARTRGMIAQ